MTLHNHPVSFPPAVDPLGDRPGPAFRNLAEARDWLDLRDNELRLRIAAARESRVERGELRVQRGESRGESLALDSQPSTLNSRPWTALRILLFLAVLAAAVWASAGIAFPWGG